MLWRDSFTIDYVEAFAVRAMLRLRDEGKCVDTVGVDTQRFPVRCAWLFRIAHRYTSKFRKTQAHKTCWII